MEQKKHIKNILKEFYRNKPEDGEGLDSFLDEYAGKILSYAKPLKVVQPKKFKVTEEKSSSELIA